MSATRTKESWLTRNVRPICALALTVNAMILALLGGVVPEGLWEVLKFALGGYVIGRSGEKIVTTLSEKGMIPWPTK